MEGVVNSGFAERCSPTCYLPQTTKALPFALTSPPQFQNNALSPPLIVGEGAGQGLTCHSAGCWAQQRCCGYCCFGKVTSVVVIDVIVVVVAVPVVRHLQAEALLGVEPLHGALQLALRGL